MRRAPASTRRVIRSTFASVERISASFCSPSRGLTSICRERLAAYKRPRDVVLVDVLPRNPSGKVLKTRLREDHGGAACPT